MEIPCQSLFFNKVASLVRTPFLQKHLGTPFFSKNTFFTKYLWTTASQSIIKFNSDYSKKNTHSLDVNIRLVDIDRSSRPQVFLRKGVLKICSKFTGEHPCRSVILIKLLCNFIEITTRRGYCLVNLVHIFRTTFPRNTSGWLLLH